MSERPNVVAEKLLAWFGLIAPLLRLTLILVLGFLQPGYSHARDYISELSAEGAPYAALMNVLGLVTVGILLLGFSIALWRALRPGVSIAGGSVMLAAAGVAFVAVGVFPCDPGCAVEAPSITMQRHILAGFLAMSAQTLAPVAIGAGLLMGKRHLRLGWTSLGLGVIAIAALAILFSQDASFPYPGALQKTFQVATDIWVFIAAWVVLGIHSDRPADDVTVEKGSGQAKLPQPYDKESISILNDCH